MSTPDIPSISIATLPVTRRTVLSGLALLVAAHPLRAEPAEQFNVESAEGPIALTRYAASGTAKRPSVLVLHGARGVELRQRAYERYANALTEAGIDTYLVRYYSPVDEQALAKISTREARIAHQDARFAAWAERVSSVISAVLARPDSSGRLGLVGFSLGGFVAAATAARDERVAALAVLYAGMPDQIAPGVKHMPPLIELHGDADRNVPLARGKALVELAKAVGAPAELVTYPGKAHGFDFADNDPATGDAVARVVSFFRERLPTA
ncbi:MULTISPECIES: dienelactone hydrolase family protein [unclassified Bradyrhizobium]|uniref:dienelactone hydrolase family protein n=1 Tax=unclassified Bradyrhizobium TaxID=2631580 RepID=UPI0028ECF33A|nr:MULTISPECIES: dienelactone hydrolase family protein [unclassified Bradyrhizobium]